VADEQPEHEWYRVAPFDEETWTLRDRITGIEGLAPNEVAENLPMWPEEGE
jgi:hypothetical protein